MKIMGKFCSNCGNQTNENDEFCSACGSRVNKSSSTTSFAPNQQTQQVYTPQYQEPKKLYRSRHDRWIFGVCGGLGRYFDTDPIIFRIIFIFLLFAYLAGFLLYILLALLVPENPYEWKKWEIKVRKRIIYSFFLRRFW